MRDASVVKRIIFWAKELYRKRLVMARSGNISCRKKIDGEIFITRHDAYLGYLDDTDVIRMDANGRISEGEGEPTSEQILHTGIYQNFTEIQTVVHAHSSYTTAFFNYHGTLEIFSFESKFYLGNIPVVPQSTPTVTNLKPVLTALENSNIVVLKHHGVVAMGNSFKETVSLIELLEEQAKVNLLIKNTASSGVQVAEEISSGKKKKYKMLSPEHSKRLTELVNNDPQAQELGKKYDLTCSLAVKNQDTGESMCFYYEHGKITRMDDSDAAEFVIIGHTPILKKVFNREIDPFVASTQGKVKTKGNFTKMSRWYPVMVRTFKLWEEAPVE